MRKCFLNNYSTSSKRKILAFTLAEVLITLGIIGVVAALTIPTLMTNIQTEQFRSQLKKEYSLLSQVYTTLSSDNQAIDTNTFISDMSTQVQIIKSGSWKNVTTLPSTFYYKCYKETSGTCSNIFARAVYGDNPSFIQKDGVEVVLTNGQPSCNGPNSNVKIDQSEILPINNFCEELRVDLNGDKGPNSVGMDLHTFYLIKENNNYYFRPSGAGVDTICSKGYPENFVYSKHCTNRMIQNLPMP